MCSCSSSSISFSNSCSSLRFVTLSASIFFTLSSQGHDFHGSIKIEGFYSKLKYEPLCGSRRRVIVVTGRSERSRRHQNMLRGWENQVFKNAVNVCVAGADQFVRNTEKRWMCLCIGASSVKSGSSPVLVKCMSVAFADWMMSPSLMMCPYGSMGWAVVKAMTEHNTTKWNIWMLKAGDTRQSWEHMCSHVIG